MPPNTAADLTEELITITKGVQEGFRRLVCVWVVQVWHKNGALECIKKRSCWRHNWDTTFKKLGKAQVPIVFMFSLKSSFDGQRNCPNLALMDKRVVIGIWRNFKQDVFNNSLWALQAAKWKTMRHIQKLAISWTVGRSAGCRRTNGNTGLCDQHSEKTPKSENQLLNLKWSFHSFPI